MTGREELLRRTQEAALDEWNGRPDLPEWDRESKMVVRVVGWRRLGPRLYYLKPASPPTSPGKLWVNIARASLRRRGVKLTDDAVVTEAGVLQGNFERLQATLRRPVLSTDQSRYLAHLCNRLLTELRGPWLRQAEEILGAVGRPDVRLAAVRRLRAVVGAVRKTPKTKTPRDVPRRDVIFGLRNVLGRKPTNREAALASILCGSEPWLSPEQTVVKTIEREVNAMRPLLKTSK